MVEYDPFSDAVLDDPLPLYRQLRTESPVHYLERYDSWALSRFEDVWNAGSDPATFVQPGPVLQTLGVEAADLLTGVAAYNTFPNTLKGAEGDAEQVTAAGITNNFGQGAARGADNRNPACHGLAGRQTEPLVYRWNDR